MSQLGDICVPKCLNPPESQGHLNAHTSVIVIWAK